MTRIKQQASGTYSFDSSYVDDDGIRQTLTAAGSLVIRDGAGVQVHTATPTLASGRLSASVPVANLSKLDTYQLTWSGTYAGSTVTWSESVELVGGFLFELADLRAMDRAFADIDKYPTSDLKRVRDWVEDVIEGPRAANIAFVPRGRRVIMDGTSPDLGLGYYPLVYGNDYRDLIVPDFAVRSIYSGSINGIALTAEDLAALDVSDNVIHRSAGVHWPAWPFGRGNITLHYIHGLAQVPGAITRAALILAKEYLVKSDLPGRATATSIGDQMFRLTIAGRDGVTGIPDVDAAIDQFGRKGYGIG